MITAYTQLHAEIEKLSPHDRELARWDLAIYGLCLLHNGRRLDPRQAEFVGGKWRIAEHPDVDRVIVHFGDRATSRTYLGPKIAMISAGRRSGKKALFSRLVLAGLEMGCNYRPETLPIWRANDPGAA